MIRLTWRQFRATAIVVVVALAAFAVVLVVTGPAMFHHYQVTTTSCRANPGNCNLADYLFTNRYGRLGEILNAALVVLPGLVGVFWGAPLVAREFETGTYRFVWTLGVSRKKWLAGKLGLLALAAVVTVGLFSLGLSLWAGPLDAIQQGRLVPGNFDPQGIVPIAYAVFAFVLGVGCGIILKRTIPAMVATAALYVGVREAIRSWLRPFYIPPLHYSATINGGNFKGALPNGSGGYSVDLMPSLAKKLNGAWIYNVRAENAAGQPPSNSFLARYCAGPRRFADVGVPPAGTQSRLPGGPPKGAHHIFSQSGPGNDCLAKLSASFHAVTTYQPASRYWYFQGIEAAIFVLLAAAIAWVCFRLLGPGRSSS